MKKIAVIGSGISGTSAAYYLNKLGFDVSLFEASSYFGGHTNTIQVEVQGQVFPVDTGFLVHNDRTYPNLIEFFESLFIKSHPSDMTFSVVKKSDDLIWAGSNLFTVFAQIKNLIRPRFYRFLGEVLRFNKHSIKYLEHCEGRIDYTLGELLEDERYSQDFKQWYLLPMGGCIWSTPTTEMLKFPAYTFLRFCLNHGLLQIFNRPQWKTVLGGCCTYVHAALKDINKKFLNQEVLEVSPDNKGVKIRTNQKTEIFDLCIVTTHPPQALNFLSGLPFDSIEWLKNFKYQKNTAIVHLDQSLLPSKKKAWSAWNYISAQNNDGHDAVSVSYLINMLQPLPVEQPVLVTLNPVCAIDETKIIKSIEYEHPLFDTPAIKAQSELEKFQGQNKIYFAGAWLRYGFHEDGILSAKKAVNQILKDTGHHERIEIL